MALKTELPTSPKSATPVVAPRAETGRAKSAAPAIRNGDSARTRVQNPPRNRAAHRRDGSRTRADQDAAEDLAAASGRLAQSLGDDIQDTRGADQENELDKLNFGGKLKVLSKDDRAKVLSQLALIDKGAAKRFGEQAGDQNEKDGFPFSDDPFGFKVQKFKDPKHHRRRRNRAWRFISRLFGALRGLFDFVERKRKLDLERAREERARRELSAAEREAVEAKKALKAERKARAAGDLGPDLEAGEDAARLARGADETDAAVRVREAALAVKAARETLTTARDAVKALQTGSELTKFGRDSAVALLLLPGLAAAFTAIAAPKTMSLAQRIKEGLTIGSYVLIPADVREALKKGNNLQAADRFIGFSDAVGLAKLAYNDPKQFMQQAKQFGLDATHLGEMAYNNPKALYAALQGLKVAASDSAIVNDAQQLLADSATGKDVTQADVGLVKDVLANSAVMNKATDAVDSYQSNARGQPATATPTSATTIAAGSSNSFGAMRAQTSPNSPNAATVAYSIPDQPVPRGNTRDRKHGVFSELQPNAA